MFFCRYSPAVFALLLASPALAGVHADIFGFAQFTGENFENVSEGFDLDYDRVRIGGKASAGAAFAGFQLDFNAEPTRDRPTGTLANVVQDLFVGWHFTETTSLKAGQFKTPIGMDFNIPGRSLDITKRGFETALVLQRDLGLMLSGRKLAGAFGYDIGVFNPAGRSGAVFGADGDPFDQEGEDYAVAGRLLYDPSEALHFEASYGHSQDAGGSDASDDYQVFDLAGRYRKGPYTLKFEYINGSNVRGVSGRDQRVYYVHGGWFVLPKLEAVVRHYDGETNAPAGNTELRNTYYGVNLFLGPPKDATNVRLQINYLDASGDVNSFTGVGGFRSDALLVQLQLSGDFRLYPR